MQHLTSRELVDDIADMHRLRSAALYEQLGRAPQLEIILGSGSDGVDGPSKNYVGIKERYSASIGLHVVTHELGASAVSATINSLNERECVDGVILQLPLPDVAPHDAEELCSQILPSKDVDGLHPLSDFEPATPLGILELLDRHEVDLTVGGVTVVGSEGKLVGRPLVEMLESRGVNPMKIDTKLGNEDMLHAAINESDVLVTATGVRGLITANMLHSDMVIVDAGVATVKPSNSSQMTFVQEGDLHADVFESALNFRATPPTGAVGPLTVRMLISNVLLAAERSTEVVRR